MTTAGTAVATKAAEKSSAMLEKLLNLAKSVDERERAYRAVEQYQQTKIVQQLADLVLAESWGNKVSPALRQQMIRFALDIGADPVRHIDVLGGKPYLNAAFYQELIASLPDFVRPEITWVHDMAELNPEEREARRALRVRWGVPTKIAATVGVFRGERDAAEKKPDIPILAACIVELHFKERGPFFGVKWSPSRAKDDVGMDFPEQSALTRAWRKAALQCAGTWFKRHPMMAKMDELIVQGREAGVVEELPPKPLVTDGGLTPEPEKAPEPAAVPALTTHNPSAKCGREGPHPVAECGYEQKP